MFISLQQPIGFSKRERLLTGPLLVQIRYKISHHSRNSNREGVPRIKSRTFQSASSAADVDIEDGTRARARTGGVRLEVAEPWWPRFLRCSCNLAHCTTRMQRARVTEGWYHKASRAIDVRVLTFHFSLVSGKRRRGLRIGYLCSGTESW